MILHDLISIAYQRQKHSKQAHKLVVILILFEFSMQHFRLIRHLEVATEANRKGAYYTM